MFSRQKNRYQICTSISFLNLRFLRKKKTSRNELLTFSSQQIIEAVNVYIYFYNHELRVRFPFQPTDEVFRNRDDRIVVHWAIV